MTLLITGNDRKQILNTLNETDLSFDRLIILSPESKSRFKSLTSDIPIEVIGCAKINKALKAYDGKIVVHFNTWYKPEYVGEPNYNSIAMKEVDYFIDCSPSM